MGLFNASRQYPKFYEPYYDTFNFYDGRDAWLESIRDIPEKAVNLFSIHWLHIEVCNGGFWQYFFNSTGTTAPEAIRGFAAIGMKDVSFLVAEAAAKLGQPYAGETEDRREIVGYPEERMDFLELDRSFYALADTPKFFRKLPMFVPFAEEYASSP
jgi:hypothetical protein